MHAFLRKSPLCRSHFFEWLKTAISSTACGRVTLKSLLPQGAYAPHVHPRLRNRLARCTLDCGVKTSESPALRGFVAERGPVRGTSLYLVLKSNGLHHAENHPVKFGFSPIDAPTNIAKKLPPQRCFKPLLIPIFNFPHKRPTFVYAGESGYTRLCSKDRTQGLTRRNRGVSDGGRYYYPRRVPQVHKHPRAGDQNGKLCRFWALAGCTLEGRREPSGQRCAYACRCSEASRPRWAA